MIVKLRGSNEPIIVDEDYKQKLKKYLGTTTLLFPIDFKIGRSGYVECRYGNEIFSFHRAMLNYYGKLHVDHINNNKLDNRVENLRLCTQAENMRNKPLQKNNTTGFKGVRIAKSKKGDRYTAVIRHDGKSETLGTFDTAIEAAKAYDAAAVKYHGMFAKTNKELGLYPEGA